MIYGGDEGAEKGQQSGKNKMDMVHPTLSFLVAFDSINHGIPLGTT